MVARFFVTTANVAVSTAIVLAAAQAPPQTQPAPSAPAQSIPETNFNVDVSALTMSVTVVDDKGKSVAGLTKDDFVLLEDGKQRPITGFRSVTETTENRIPIGLGILLDVSRSLTRDRQSALRVAIQALLTKRLNKSEDEIYLMEFAQVPRLVVPWTRDRQQIIDGVNKLKVKEGTAIFDAIAAALPISAQGKNKKQVILVLTDGIDYNSQIKRPALAEMARRAEVLIYGLIAQDEERVRGGNNDTSLARQGVAELSLITDATGGRTQFVQGLQQMEDALSIFGKDLVSQYEISFERSAPKDGQFHPVRVGVRRQGVVVRHKLGYLSN
jgi:VWFA-related protein